VGLPTRPPPKLCSSPTPTIAIWDRKIPTQTEHGTKNRQLGCQKYGPRSCIMQTPYRYRGPVPQLPKIRTTFLHNADSIPLPTTRSPTNSNNQTRPTPKFHNSQHQIYRLGQQPKSRPRPKVQNQSRYIHPWHSRNTRSEAVLAGRDGRSPMGRHPARRVGRNSPTGHWKTEQNS